MRRYTEKIKAAPDEVRKVTKNTGSSRFVLSLMHSVIAGCPKEVRESLINMQSCGVAAEALWLVIPGLYHLHGKAGHVIGL